jgi:hypothetical protein
MMNIQQMTHRKTQISGRPLTWLAGAVSLLLACHTAQAAPADPAKFPLLKDLIAPTNATQKIAAFTMDEEVFDATDDDYSNMRVFDSRDRETPFLVRIASKTKPVVTEKQIDMAAISFEPLSSNTIEIVVENKTAEATPSAVVIVTKQKNYEKQVTVSGSRDRNVWTILASNVPIFDYSRYMDLSNNKVEMSISRFRYYKVEIANFAEWRLSPLLSIVREKRGDEIARDMEASTLITEDFRIEEVKFLEKKESIVEGEKVLRQYAVHNLMVTGDLKNQETIVTIDAQRQPLTSLTIFARDPNFSRTVEVYGSNEKETAQKSGRRPREDRWEHITSSVVSMIVTGGFTHERKTIELGRACRYHRYKIVVHNMDNPPLAVYGMKAEGEIHEALFFCDPARTYRLLYGVKEIDAPRYDIAAVLENKTAGTDADVFSLSAGHPNPKMDQKKAESQPVVSNRTLITGAVLLMVATLLWLITVALKGMAGAKGD